jgi:hypothetical protein
MPFSKYIKHEHIEAMRAAFYKVCDALLLNGDVDDPMTEVVVDKIVALAKAGEHNVDRLALLRHKFRRVFRGNLRAQHGQRGGILAIAGRSQLSWACAVGAGAAAPRGR